MRWLLLALTLPLASCDITLITTPTDLPADSVIDSGQTTPSRPGAGRDVFGDVVRAVQPVAAQECRRRAPLGNCDFLVVVDQTRRAPANAYQSVDEKGRPLLTFTTALISNARNPDELAFILSHEAAHHIVGHLARQEQNAAAGAEVFAELATLTGGDAADVAEAQKLGAAVGARSYSKEFELEADELGTVITHRAGFDPVLGAQFFMRIPDPGDQFLSSHPPNAARYDMVVQTSARLGPPG